MGTLLQMHCIPMKANTQTVQMVLRAMLIFSALVSPNMKAWGGVLQGLVMQVKDEILSGL